MKDERLLNHATNPPSVLHRSRIALRTSILMRSAVFFKTRGWLWPVVGAVLISALGWLIYSAMERVMREQMEDKLQVILNTDLKALDIWISDQSRESETLARGLRDNFEELKKAARETPEKKQKPESALRDHAAQTQMREALMPVIRKMGGCGYVVVDNELNILAASEDIMIGQPISDGPFQAMLKRALKGEDAFAPPHVFPLAMKASDGNIKTSQPMLAFANSFTAFKADAKPGVLAVMSRPEGDFTGILQIGRYGQSGETYAFDSGGLMLSESRFDEQLKTAGLMTDKPGRRTLLTVELRDPGVNTTEGATSATPRSRQPLTRMAADCVLGRDGVDVVGYRDYRGAPVIGAWRWLKQYGFGVTTEVDKAEAYKPLGILRLSFGVLLALLFLSAGVIYCFMLILARQSENIHSAVAAAKQLGQYHLHEKLGEGGMGAVYKASHSMLRRPTAVKVLSKEKASAESVARFEREVQATARLNHPNTISIFDYGRTPEGDFYYAMEYLDGITLEQLVLRSGPLGDGRVLGILKQVCLSLAEAHAEGLIHRDIKPSNIIINRRGGVTDFVKVLDFGLVKPMGIPTDAGLTNADTLVGTPLYISPEALSNPELVDGRSDLYAVGAVGYFLLTGGPVFDCMSVMEICLKHAKDKPAPVGGKARYPVSASLETLIMRCLAKEQLERPQTAREMSNELEACRPATTWSIEDAEAWWRAYEKTRAIEKPVAAPGLAETVTDAVAGKP